MTAFEGPAGASRRWWQEPLPAWAQLAAAVLIFAAGVSVGAGRTSLPASAVDTSASSVSVAELENAVASIDRRIAGLETAPRAVSEDRLAEAIEASEFGTRRWMGRLYTALVADQTWREEDQEERLQTFTTRRLGDLEDAITTVSVRSNPQE